RYVTIRCPHKTSGGNNRSQSIFFIVFTDYFYFSVNAAGPILSKLTLGVIITFVWIIAGLLAVPHSMFNQLVPIEYNNQTYIRCRVVYPKLGQIDFPFWLSIEAFLTQYL